MRYVEKEKDTINGMKIYLKAMRELMRERFQLLEEYNEEPSPHSPSFDQNRGAEISQITKMNNLTMKRDLILKKIEFFNYTIDEFTLRTLLLTTRHRQIINVYMNARSYQEMLEELNEKYMISTSTYKREFPAICLQLARYIDFSQVPSIIQLNEEFMKTVFEPSLDL